MRNQHLYAYSYQNSPGELMVYKSTDPVSAKLKEEGDQLFVTVDKSDSSNLGKIVEIGKAELPKAPKDALDNYEVPTTRGWIVAPSYYFSSKEAAYSYTVLKVVFGIL